MASAALPDIAVEVHGCDLEPSLLNSLRRDGRQIWVAVDLLGLGVGGVGHALRTAPLIPTHENTALHLDARVPVVRRRYSYPVRNPRTSSTSRARTDLAYCIPLPQEPGEPIWQPLQEALASKEEQDSDCYFVLYSGPMDSDSDATTDRVELGTAHLNLEALMKRTPPKKRDPEHERLPVVDAQTERVAWLTVSMKVVDALKWAQSHAGGGCRITVGVGELAIDAEGGERAEQAAHDRGLVVQVELPGELPLLRTPQLVLAGDTTRGTFAFSSDAKVAPASAAHLALVAALEAEDESLADVYFTLVAVAEKKGGRERDLGFGAPWGVVGGAPCVARVQVSRRARSAPLSPPHTAPAKTCFGVYTELLPCRPLCRPLRAASLNLHDLLRKGADASNVALTLRDERRAATGETAVAVATLRVSLSALAAIDQLTHSVHAAEKALAPASTRQLLRLSRAVRNNAPLPEAIEAAVDPEALEEEEESASRRGIDFELLDSLSAKSLAELAGEGEGRRSDVQEVRAQKSLRAMVDSAQRLAACR